MSDVNTLVGRGSHFEGKMTFEGVVRVDGSFEGEIVSDDTLIIGEGAEVRA
ncbi:MAG: polymer-forming cytoskeletal protein, partial [Deltaproteobacteria bacterium]|nr:polymer-forming cytoskeletal protein [Deltaproteobacteria bacterium]